MAERVWYSARNGQQRGPIGEQAMRQAAERGELLPTDLVWTEGMAQWSAAGSVGEFSFPAGSAALPSPGIPAASGSAYSAPAAAPLQYGRPASQYGGPTLDYQAQYQLQYAGFWLRVAAALIDGIIMTLAGVFVGAIIGGFAGAAGMMRGANLDPSIELLIQLLTTVMQWLYYSLMECSEKQATLGKMAVGIRVTDMNGRRIGFGKATGRYFGKIISALILFIGFMMAGWTEKKQALHDMMAGTLVVRK